MTSDNEKQPISDEQEQMLECFCGLAPRVAEFPHSIVASGPASLEIALRCTGAKPGIWGQDPLVDTNGEPFFPPESGVLDEFFAVWELPQNQKEIERYIAQGGNSSKFTMVIDARTPPSVLRAMYEAIDVDLSDYCYYIDKVADWIDDLQWAYIPLDVEHCDFALFVVSRDRVTLMNQVRGELRKRQTVCFELIKSGHLWLWTGPVRIH